MLLLYFSLLVKCKCSDEMTHDLVYVRTEVNIKHWEKITRISIASNIEVYF
jgi:hypothetical protein